MNSAQILAMPEVSLETTSAVMQRSYQKVDGESWYTLFTKKTCCKRNKETKITTKKKVKNTKGRDEFISILNMIPVYE